MTEWMKKVEAAKWEAQRPADRSEAAHAERMAQVERDRYALAKAVNDLELSLQKEEASRAHLVERIANVQEKLETIRNESGHLSEDRIRSLVFRQMGISWAMEELSAVEKVDDWKDQPLKCRVLCRNSNDVYTLSFSAHSHAQSNPFNDANVLWSHLAK